MLLYIRTTDIDWISTFDNLRIKEFLSFPIPSRKLVVLPIPLVSAALVGRAPLVKPNAESLSDASQKLFIANIHLALGFHSQLYNIICNLFVLRPEILIFFFARQFVIYFLLLSKNIYLFFMFRGSFTRLLRAELLNLTRGSFAFLFVNFFFLLNRLLFVCFERGRVTIIWLNFNVRSDNRNDLI